MQTNSCIERSMSLSTMDSFPSLSNGFYSTHMQRWKIYVARRESRTYYSCACTVQMFIVHTLGGLSVRCCRHALKHLVPRLWHSCVWGACVESIGCEPRNGPAFKVCTPLSSSLALCLLISGPWQSSPCSPWNHHAFLPGKIEIPWNFELKSTLLFLHHFCQACCQVMRNNEKIH